MNTKFALAAVLAASAGLAQAETDLSLARSYELNNAASEYSSLLNNSNAANLKVSAQVQARYQANFRDDASTTLANPDDDTTIGFSIRRAKITVAGDVTDNISAQIRFAFDRNGGAAVLENAYADWAINDDLTLRMGQFKQQLIREENVSSSRQLASERSTVNETINQGYSQGIEAHFGGDSWRGAVGFSDGLNSANTPFSSTAEADYALNARFEFLLGGDAEWSQFKQFTSWRGSNAGGMLGAAIAWQSMGDTNPSAPAGSSDMTTATVDFSWVADGWNAYVAGIWQSMSPATGVDTDVYGIVAQGGFFVTDQDELFGRYDLFMPDDSNAPADEDFNAITVGWNHYFVPESHAAKFTLDLAYYLDATTTSTGVSTSDGHNLLPDSEDGQLALTAQFQFLF
jgi:hypothetical protein